MTTLQTPPGRTRAPLRLALAVAMAAVLAPVATIPAAAETQLAGASPDLASAMAQGLTLTMDQARVMRLPPLVSTLVIGNPLIADASVQRGGIMVLTGKSVGSTNLIALDARGEPLLTLQVRVRVQNDAVVQVYRGADRETYSCSPTCERTIAVGDSKTFFETALGNTRQRDGAASGGTTTPR